MNFTRQEALHLKHKYRALRAHYENEPKDYKHEPMEALYGACMWAFRALLEPTEDGKAIAHKYSRYDLEIYQQLKTREV